MFSQTIPLYLSCAALAVAMGVAAPLWSGIVVQRARGIASIGLWVAAVVLVIIVLQQLVAMAVLEWASDATLPASPFTWLIEMLSPAPAYSAGGIRAVWWREELRLLSALVVCLPVLHLGLRDQLLRIDTKQAGNPLVLGVGGLLLTMPLGFLLWGYGQIATVRAIVSPRRQLDSLPPLDQWLWQANTNVIGFAHVWIFKALVPALGLMLIVLGMLHIMTAGQSLRQRGKHHAGG